MNARQDIEAALALAPTEGQWLAIGRVVENADDHLPDICSTIDRAGLYDSDDQQCIDCSYIAAVQPSAIRALLAEHDAELAAAIRHAAQPGQPSLASLLQMQEDHLLAARIAEGYRPASSPPLTMPLGGLLYAKLTQLGQPAVLYEAAAMEAVELLKTLGYVYEMNVIGVLQWASPKVQPVQASEKVRGLG